MMNRRTLIAALSASVALPAFAMEPENYIVNGYALSGYDAVAYFTLSDAVVGNDAHQSEYNGATYRFSSAEHKTMFDANPEKYAPKYGGYCAYAVSRGYTASADPEAWTVHEGRLYVNFSKSVRAIWTTRRAKNIEAADANWPAVLG